MLDSSSKTLFLIGNKLQHLDPEIYCYLFYVITYIILLFQFAHRHTHIFLCTHSLMHLLNTVPWKKKYCQHWTFIYFFFLTWLPEHYRVARLIQNLHGIVAISNPEMNLDIQEDVCGFYACTHYLREGT